MRPIIEGPPQGDEPKRPLSRKIGWFLALWFGGLIATATLAYTLRAMIIPQ